VLLLLLEIAQHAQHRVLRHVQDRQQKVMVLEKELIQVW
jgi:hypothetical protein